MRKIGRNVAIIGSFFAILATQAVAQSKKESLVLSQKKVEFSSEEGAPAPAAELITAQVSNTKSTVFYLVESQTALVKSASVALVNGGAQIKIAPEVAAKVPEGNNSGIVLIKACKDQKCKVQFAGSPAAVTVKYKVKKKNKSSSSLSSSSSSSSVSATACTNSLGDVFFDEVCSPWRPVSAYEQNYADYTNAYETSDGNASSGARFNIVQSTDSCRNKVLDIHYLDAPEFFSAVHIRAPEAVPEGIDMSEFANGKIQFDLKVISQGSFNAPLEFSLDCSWPCASTPKLIRVDQLNQWKTYEFSVAEMIDRGLDITRVSQGFMLLPTWAMQAGAHYQVDNVRWIKGNAPKHPESICYSNFLDTPWAGGVSGTGVSIIGIDREVPWDQLMNLTQGVLPWVKANPNWSLMNFRWLYAISTEMNYQTGDLTDPDRLSSCSGAGTLSLEVYTPAALVADGKLTFSLSFVRNDWSVMDIPNSTFSMAGMKADDWNKISVPLSALTMSTNLKFVAMNIDATSVSPSLQAGFNVDNILIKQPAKPGAVSSRSSSSRSVNSSSAANSSSVNLSSTGVSFSSSSLGSNSPVSSSVASSESRVMACNGTMGDVFFDGVCSPWRSVSAYEQNYADSTNAYETTDGNTSGGARFNVIESSEPGRGSVLDIHYLNSPAFFCAVRIRVPESESNAVDMSDYADGKVVFDLKVIQNSDANAPLEFTLDCSWPCASTPKFIRVAALNEWKTYEFSVAELIARGLDIKRVSMGFMLLPTWGQQSSAHYQVDNIRWVKGDASTRRDYICYSNFFDTPWNGGVSGVGVLTTGMTSSIPSEALATLTQGVIPWVTTTPDWSLMNNQWAYLFSGAMNYQTMEVLDPFALPDCSGAGTLSVEIYTPAELVADGQVTFSLALMDSSWDRVDLPGTFSAADMKPNEWNKVSVPLSAFTYRSNWKYVSVMINGTNVSPTLRAGFNIDNIVIKHPLQ